MSVFALYEAKNRLSELVDRAIAGETIEITRHGKVVARIAPPEDADESQKRALEAIGRLREAAKGVSLGGLSSRDLIRAGRR